MSPRRERKDVIAIDSASASLEVAQRKPHADRVRWVHGDGSAVPAADADLATMTVNVAQVFLSEDDWLASLHAARAALRQGGSLVLEVRDPARRAWEAWTRAATHRTVRITTIGTVRTWIELTDVRLPFVSFCHSFEFESDGTVLTSESTLRFRDQGEIVDSLTQVGLAVRDIRRAPDRPGLEFVFIAQRNKDDREPAV